MIILGVTYLGGPIQELPNAGGLAPSQFQQNGIFASPPPLKSFEFGGRTNQMYFEDFHRFTRIHNINMEIDRHESLENICNPKIRSLVGK